MFGAQKTRASLFRVKIQWLLPLFCPNFYHQIKHYNKKSDHCGEEAVNWLWRSIAQTTCLANRYTQKFISCYVTLAVYMIRSPHDLELWPLTVYVFAVWHFMHMAMMLLWNLWCISFLNFMEPGNLDLWPFDLKTSPEVACDIWFLPGSVSLSMSFYSWVKCRRMTDWQAGCSAVQMEGRAA